MDSVEELTAERRARLDELERRATRDRANREYEAYAAGLRMGRREGDAAYWMAGLFCGALGGFILACVLEALRLAAGMRW
jgi:hypothetical protein